MARTSLFPKIEILAVDSIDQLAAILPVSTKYFTLFLAWDAPDESIEQLAEIFRPLVERGMCYLCAWGKNCELVHDAVDHCVVIQEMATGEADYLLMTTWHDRESLEDAFWYFDNLAIPAENHVYADFERFAVTIGATEWKIRMEHLFRQT